MAGTRLAIPQFRLRSADLTSRGEHKFLPGWAVDRGAEAACLCALNADFQAQGIDQRSGSTALPHRGDDLGGGRDLGEAALQRG